MNYKEYQIFKRRTSSARREDINKLRNRAYDAGLGYKDLMNILTEIDEKEKKLYDPVKEYFIRG